jgi:hypothetical protein
VRSLIWMVLLSAAATAGPPGSEGEGTKICADLVYLASPDVHFRSVRRDLKRVEVRRCRDARANVLQLAAWKQGEKHPTILRDTDRFAVSQVVMFNDVVVVEFGGGGSNRLFVITFENGHPTIALEDGYKAYAQIETTRLEVLIRIPQARGDPRVHRFRTGLE